MFLNTIIVRFGFSFFLFFKSRIWLVKCGLETVYTDLPSFFLSDAFKMSLENQRENDGQL